MFWLVITINVGQAAGVVLVPFEVLQASWDSYEVVGVLPTVITDGGAFILVLVLLAFYIKFRTPWARRAGRRPHRRTRHTL